MKETQPLPNANEELWRYSRIDDFPTHRFVAAKQGSRVTESPTLSDLRTALGVENAIVTRNGFLSGSPLDVTGLDVQSATGNAESMTSGAVPFSEAFADAQATALTVTVADGAQIEEPVFLLHYLDQEGGACFPAVDVQVGASARVQIVEVVISDDVHCVAVPQTRVTVGDGASANYVNLQMLSDKAWQFGFQTSRVGKDARLRSTSIAFGGYYARVETESHLVGKGAEALLNALYFGSGNQMHDFRTLQAHDAPKTTSDLLFKGAVGGTARSVYSGLIRVTKGAAGTRAFQTNRNVVLSDGAHADSVPNLEIDEQDVACSHASAVGPVDEDQIFYLESRGVPEHVARRLVVLGFLGEMIDNVGLEKLSALTGRLLGEKLNTVDQTPGNQQLGHQQSSESQLDSREQVAK